MYTIVTDCTGKLCCCINDAEDEQSILLNGVQVFTLDESPIFTEVPSLDGVTIFFHPETNGIFNE